MAGGGLHRHPDRGDRGALRDDLDAAARPGDPVRGSCRDPRRTRRLLDDSIPARDDDEQHGLRPPAGGLRPARVSSRVCPVRDSERDLRHVDQRNDQRGRRQLLAILGERHVRDRRRGPRGLARRRRGPVDVLRSSGGMMSRGWRAAVDAGLGDNRTRILGVFLILLAILGTYVMRAYANIETVFVASLLAGSLLGRWWTVLVPLSALAVLQPLERGLTGVVHARSALRGFAVGQGIAVGACRGAAAGSSDADRRGIARADPVRYGRLLQRSLRPARIPMPAMGIGLADDRRNEVSL